MAEEKQKKPYSAAGRPRAYSPEQLDKAVERYFRKITRLSTVTELVPTGNLDKYGHEIMEQKPVKNRDGEEIQQLEYLVTPCVSSLCSFLGISRSTWASYCQISEYSDTTTRARGRFQNYLEQENLERDDKHLKGIQFDLMNNYGYREKIDVTSETMEDYLDKITEAGEGQTL